jgi:prepilin-type N-terminal cleavage/methylation domain-containing protein
MDGQGGDVVRRSRGFTLLELMVAMGMLAFAAASVAGVVHQIRSEEKIARDYTDDLEGLRSALRTIESDLLSATKIEGAVIDSVPYALDDNNRLLRDGEVVAESVGSFSIRQRMDFVTVRISPAPRARGRSISPRELVCEVHLRRLEETR